ncbi:holin [Bacillus cereus]|uniref:holin n=1 Tax=Bacillus cereus TaxID=1396 RepID=UPI00187AD054|nr:holin [Bacillus cereus]MBE7123651.1 holin [Bacillus cereus]
MIEITAMIGVVVGLSQIAKTIGLQTKYIPLFNLTLGITLGVLFLSQDIKTNILQGIIMGLSASGLFDHTKIIKKDADGKCRRDANRFHS